MSVVIDGTNGITAPGTETFGSGTALGGATNPIVSMAKGANNYVQGYVVNNTAGVSSSADLVTYPDNGTDAHGWVDMGITSSVYADATYTVTGPNEAYLFGSAPSGAGKTGNLVLATDNTGTANSIQFYTNGFTQAKSAARVTIEGSTGNLLVGTTTSSAPSSGVVSVASSGSFVTIGHASGTASGQQYALFYYNSGLIGSIAQSGTTGVLYNITSDRRLKTDIVDFTDSGTYIDAFKPRSFVWHEGTPDIGFITDEYQQVLPSAITGQPDAVDEEGNPVYQQGDFATSAKMAIIIAELQSLRKRVAELESK